MKFSILLIALFCLTSVTLQAQGGRFFIDAPAFYAQSTDFSKIKEAVGLGAQGGFSYGGHHYKLGVAAGVDANANLLSTGKFSEKVDFKPYAQLEFGAGFFRTNGQKCSIHNRNAYTAMPVAIIRHDFTSKKSMFLIGAELSYFNIRDMVKNTELFLNINYNAASKAVGGAFGMRIFFNLNNLGDR
jgi:hypothetical protein